MERGEFDELGAVDYEAPSLPNGWKSADWDGEINPETGMITRRGTKGMCILFGEADINPPFNRDDFSPLFLPEFDIDFEG